MKLNKKIVSVIAIATFVPASIAGVGVGIWYSQPKIKDLSSLISNKDLGVISEADKTNQKLLLNLIKEKNPSLDINKVELVIQENKVIIKPKVGDKTYQGQVEITFSLGYIDLTKLIKETNLGTINESDLDDTNKLIDLIKQKNQSIDVDFDKLDLEINRDAKTIIVKPKNGNKTYKGEVTLNFLIKTKINEIEDLNTNAGIFNSNTPDAIISQFIENNKDRLEDLTKDDFDVVSNDNGKLKIRVKDSNTQYQGEIEIIYSVKDQFSSIEKIEKEITNLKNNDTESVLNRFVELNSSLLDSNKITRDQLKAVVADDVATITIDGNDKYQGSIETKLNLSKQTQKYLGVLSNNDKNSILKEVVNRNSWNLNSNDLDIQVKGNTATITGKTEKNKKFIGTITAEFGLTATYTNNNKELTRIGFFKNNANEWQIEKVKTDTNKVVSVLPAFITSLEDAFEENKSETILGIESWNTRNVTNMSHTFSKAKNFNHNVGNWDTSKVTNMSHMFAEAKNFNQYIGRWNTSNVTNMDHMFYSAKKFNNFISEWDTSKVTNMSSMFYGANIFNQSIGNWDTSNVTDMGGMFGNAYEFNQDISKKTVKRKGGSTYTAWDTSKVTDMSYMFQHTENFNTNIGNWNTSKVKDMRHMFAGAQKFNQNIGSWDVKSVENMAHMFESAKVFNQNLTRWEVKQVKDHTKFNLDGVMNNSNIPHRFR
ncbi:BspA family leucine-rich repeat surface protein [Mycoplasma yeatsii]|uniref:BspA family leucine-rich repeat surface protein n=1 Tax=Mycoplasma yeatsii TaxID=51365 RepID=UPI0005B2430E|nr:BspA family leucine-rich repeat surface protein [Mycoplasma yeatsii]AJM71940.1 PARCEL domain-containing protein [Mycoplasma yeatsii GM274B]